MNRPFRQGLKAGSSVVPTFIAIFIGFGIAAVVVGMPALAAFLSTWSLFAAPAQFAMVDIAQQSSVVLQIVSVGILVNLRFFVMSLTLAALFPPLPRRRLALWAQFVSASSYLLTFFHSRRAPQEELFDYYRGVVVMSFPAAVIGTALGIWFGSGLPPLFTFGASLFLPVYFALLLSSEVRKRREVTAVVLGFIGTPPLELLVPGWGLFIAAIAAGLVVGKLRQ